MNATAEVRDLGALARAARAPTIIGLVVLAAAILIALLTERTAPGYLDPTSPTETGSRAIAALARDQGVTVDVVHTAAEARVPAGTTLLVPFPDRLAPAQLDAVRASGADVVLVAPSPEALAALAPEVEITAHDEEVGARDPGCDLPAAVRAGAATVGGYSYRADRAVACYPSKTGAAVLQVVDGGRTITVLGSPDVLLNRSLADEGNAALALNLLGRPTAAGLVRAPVPEGPPVASERSLLDLVPPGWLVGRGAARRRGRPARAVAGAPARPGRRRAAAGRRARRRDRPRAGRGSTGARRARDRAADHLRAASPCPARPAARRCPRGRRGRRRGRRGRRGAPAGPPRDVEALLYGAGPGRRRRAGPPGRPSSTRWREQVRDR